MEKASTLTYLCSQCKCCCSDIIRGIALSEQLSPHFVFRPQIRTISRGGNNIIQNNISPVNMLLILHFNAAHL